MRSLGAMDTRWNHPFTCVVPGPVECGKTIFVARLLLRASSVIDSPPKTMTRRYWECQPTYAMLVETVPNSRCKEGLPNASLFHPSSRNLVVTDTRHVVHNAIGLIDVSVSHEIRARFLHRRNSGIVSVDCSETKNAGSSTTIFRITPFSTSPTKDIKRQTRRLSRHSQDIARVKRHILCLHMLNIHKNIKLRNAVLADADLICDPCEYNLLKGNVPLTRKQKS